MLLLIYFEFFNAIDVLKKRNLQVSRMLLGGMHVVGIYVWASEGSFKASNLVLWQVK